MNIISKLFRLCRGPDQPERWLSHGDVPPVDLADHAIRALLPHNDALSYGYVRDMRAGQLLLEWLTSCGSWPWEYGIVMPPVCRSVAVRDMEDAIARGVVRVTLSDRPPVPIH